MPTIHLGVVDLPYGHTENIGKVKKGKNAGKPYASTTGDVAEILEEKYGVMEAFWTLHEQEILDAFSESIVGEMDSILEGKPYSFRAFASGEDEVVNLFDKFLSNKEMDRVGRGDIPTEAAKRGVSHRFKHPYARRASRPSFIDTGLYEYSFFCWVD